MEHEINNILSSLGIPVEGQPEYELEPTETPLMVLMNDLISNGYADPPLIDFICEYLDLEAVHIAMAYDAGSEAAAKSSEEDPPEDGVDYYERLYT